MPIHNKQVADTLLEYANYLELNDENPHRVRAYRNGARTLMEQSEKLTHWIKKDKDLSKLPGIGSSLAEKIEEIIKTGKLKELEQIKKDIDIDVENLKQIEQLGTERIKTLYNELGIKDIDSLKKALKNNKLQELEGFGKKMEDKIKEELKSFSKKEDKRYKWPDAEEVIMPFFKYLQDFKDVEKLDIAGSFRRRKETVGDIDILAVTSKRKELVDYFTNFEDVDKVLSKGKKRSSVVMNTGLQVDLRMIEKEKHGAALMYFTGSKEFSVELRKIAIEKNLKLNEYGVYKEDKLLAAKTEKAVLDKLGLHYIAPELRENRGEIELAQKKENQLPHLIKEEDLEGDLQCHSKWSDGKNTIKEMAEKAIGKGYSYLAITDHSKKVSMANGLDEKRLREQMEEIDKLNEDAFKNKNFRLLKACEVDILEDGSLDLPDSVIKELDIVLCAVHYNRKLPAKKQTGRIIRAMDNKYCNIIVHPTGRLINEREPYDINIEKIMDAAIERNCFLEINSDPDRLDLNDINAKMAKDKGLKLSISTDSHSTSGLDHINYGIGQARRGWIEKEDVINTRPWNQLKKLLKR